MESCSNCRFFAYDEADIPYCQRTDEYVDGSGCDFYENFHHCPSCVYFVKVGETKYYDPSTDSPATEIHYGCQYRHKQVQYADCRYWVGRKTNICNTCKHKRSWCTMDGEGNKKEVLESFCFKGHPINNIKCDDYENIKYEN